MQHFILCVSNFRMHCSKLSGKKNHSNSAKIPRNIDKNSCQIENLVLYIIFCAVRCISLHITVLSCLLRLLLSNSTEITCESCLLCIMHISLLPIANRSLKSRHVHTNIKGSLSLNVRLYSSS